MDYIKNEDIEKAKFGNPQAIEKIFRTYNGLTKSCASRYFSVGLENDDLIQEAMIGLFKAIQSFDVGKKSNFTAFAKICITRQVISAIKMANAQKHRVLNESVREEKMDVDAIDVNNEKMQDSPEVIMMEKEILQEIYDKIKENLSPLELRVLLLYAQGMDYKSINKKLNISSKTVDNSLQRARKKLSNFNIRRIEEDN
ncbi:MAG: sigma-70 family RNA polymerase sigma factor [Filifactoraceae bacterium]